MSTPSFRIPPEAVDDMIRQSRGQAATMPAQKVPPPEIRTMQLPDVPPMARDATNIKPSSEPTSSVVAKHIQLPKTIVDQVKQQWEDVKGKSNKWSDDTVRKFNEHLESLQTSMDIKAKKITHGPLSDSTILTKGHDISKKIVNKAKGITAETNTEEKAIKALRDARQGWYTPGDYGDRYPQVVSLQKEIELKGILGEKKYNELISKAGLENITTVLSKPENRDMPRYLASTPGSDYMRVLTHFKTGE